MENIVKKGCLVAICLSVIFTSVAFAEPVTTNIAEAVGSTFLKGQASVERAILEKQTTSGKASENYAGHVISSVRECRSGKTGELLAYVFALDPKGFVVVSPDTGITPVIAYSFEGDFNWEDSEQNALLNILTYDMQQRLKALPSLPEDFKDKNHDLWVKYFVEETMFLNDMAESATYGPLLSTTWHQTSPYNDYCPIDPTTTKRSVTGCVATAMAQIVNYHACTKTVTFTSADNYTTDTRKINVDASTANMSGITYPASDTTAGKLSYACGVSVKMDYTSDESGATTSDVANALKSKFGFQSATAYAPQSGYDVPVLATFYDKLQANMKDGKPAQLAIQSSSGGHSIVCDGYDSTTGQYHLNFGWGSSSPTPPWWYTLPSGMPAGYTIVKYGVLDITSSCTQPSCPDLYSWNGGSYDLAGPLFLGTHSPLSEWYQKRRVVAPVKPQGNELVFKVKEIDGEESYINSAAILYSFRWAPADKRWAPLPLISATHSRLGDVSGPLMAQDEARVHTVPGDEIVLRYGIPHPELGSSLFESGPSELEFMGWSTGYYLWQNETWCETWSLYPEVSVQPGGRVMLDAMVNNMTTKELPESAEVWFVLKDQGGSRIGPVSVSGLAPATPMWVTYDWQVPEGLAAGVYTYAPRVYVGDTDVTWDDLKLKVPPKNARLVTASPAEASRCSN